MPIAKQHAADSCFYPLMQQQNDSTLTIGHREIGLLTVLASAREVQYQVSLGKREQDTASADNSVYQNSRSFDSALRADVPKSEEVCFRRYNNIQHQLNIETCDSVAPADWN